MKQPSSIASVWFVAACCTAGLGLMFVPVGLTQPLRIAVRDGLRPGQGTLRIVLTNSVSVWAGLWSGRNRDAEFETLQQRLHSAELQNRRLMAENAMARQKLARTGAQAIDVSSVQTPAPLFRPELVRAQVLGDEMAGLWRGRKLIGAGKANGLQESTLVLDDRRAILDQGADARVANEQPVYSGRIVVGKVAVVGRWTSTLQLVTDAGYIGSARLARPTSQGTVFGSEGKLEGDGSPLCRLKYIQSTEPVREGDLVFTGETDSVHPLPMYYGTVTRAALEEGNSHWLIWVKPAAADERLETVQVLRTTLNPDRLLAD